MRYLRHAPPLYVLALAALGLASVSTADDAAGPYVPTVAVFPLTDPDEQPHRMVGRRACDAIHAALQAEGPWELADPAWLLRLSEAEGLLPPLAVGHLQMIGQRMRAPLAIGGLVESCVLNPERGVAQVTLAIELVETLGGSSLASARGVASAQREQGEPLDLALDRALSEAAADAARHLTAFDTASAVVVSTLPDGRVVMDGPLEPRIKPGTKLLVLRGGEMTPQVIGAVQVKTSSLTVLHAEPLSGEGFFQGDRAVVVAR